MAWSNCRAWNRVSTRISGCFLLFAVTLGVVLCAASPTFAATTAAGSCPTGNTIDPDGNPVSLSSLGVTSCFYVSKATGVDSNTGTDEGHPWAHLPGMPSCTNTCASTTPGGGVGFILRGGDTWTSNDLGVNWQWSGSSGHPIYVGVDQSWFNSSCGSSWCRPIWDAQSSTNSTMFLAGGNTTYWITDNIEMKGMRNNQNGYWVQGAQNVRITQNYFHGWSHTGSTDNVGFFAQGGSGSMADHNVIDGSDSSKNTFNGFYSYWGIAQYNYIGYTVSGVLGNMDDFHGNLVENGITSVDGDHCNLVFIFHPNSGNTLYAYNNLIRKQNCNGGVILWLNGNAGCSNCTTYVYNNVIDATQGIWLGAHPSSGNAGTYYAYNNTIAIQGGYCIGNGESPPRSTTNLANNQCIGGSPMCGATGTTCVDGGGNMLESMSQANSQGYTSSEAEEYSPANSSAPTVGAGVNESSFCTGDGDALCSSTSYLTYNSTQNTVKASAINNRGGNWDIGAYEYAAGTGTPNPPTGLAAIVQ